MTQRSQMPPRPISVTVICWCLIAIGILGGVPFLFTMKVMNDPVLSSKIMNDPKMVELMHKNPIPLSVQIGMGAFGCLLHVICGIGMLIRKNLARLVFVGTSILFLLIQIVISSYKLALIFPIIILAANAFFLFRPKANAYFNAPARFIKKG